MALLDLAKLILLVARSLQLDHRPPKLQVKGKGSIHFICCMNVTSSNASPTDSGTDLSRNGSQGAHAGGPQEAKKRTKTQRACDSCRSRKIRYALKTLVFSFLSMRASSFRSLGHRGETF